MSRIRANQITNQSADGAPTVQNGLVISGVTTSTTFSGSGASLTNLPAAQLTGTLPAIDGSNLTNITSTTINNNANNRLITGSGTANTLEGEANLTFDGDSLLLLSSTDGRRVSFAGGGTSHYMKFDNTLNGIILNGYGGITFETNGTNERLRIDSSGNMGQGTATPTTPDGSNADNSNNGKVLTIYGDSPAINLIHNTAGGGSAGSTDYAAINFGRNGSSSNPYRAVIGYKQVEDILHINAQNHIVFETGGNINTGEAMRITSDGHTLFSGLTTKNDPRNANGITLKSTSGVSFQNYGSNGSRNWRIRPDDQSRWGDLDFSVSPTANSATDWPDAASDKVLTLGYDGQVSKPRQASFAAMKSGNAYGLNGQVFPFDTTTHNVGNHFNTSNYRFTAPVAGRYLFTFYSIYNSSGQGRYEILINGAADQNGTRVHMNNYNTNWDNTSNSWILNLSANDYVQMYSNTNTGWHGGHWQRFCGELLS